MDLSPFAPYLGVIQLIFSVVIVVLVILQAKGADLGGLMGGESSSSFRTKRGLEAMLHKVTIYFSIAFFTVTIFTFIAMGQ
jgi:preprotein translocase subunit SecG